MISHRLYERQGQASATINFNNWLKFFNVRSNPIDLTAGNSYSIKLTPFQHNATEDVKALYYQRRKCHFEDEQEFEIIVVVNLTRI